ncbi:SDR family oxidoreductase [uncultured Halopseudomonas sp.]|uniref:SDR family NAD(P)-dependent oxidoreductase n=1 Tax=uncultured Halopseudomonas sp. TaxID=2901193 RepID=UPI0030ED4B59|tara:strand:- start:37467 stop:38147 length:681 start_codon:yes stop_codon:yes gene_type:complete
MAFPDLAGKRILLTQADVFMGPVLMETLLRCGADVISSTATLEETHAADELIAQSGELDVLLINLGVPAPSTPAEQADDAEWRLMFERMVDPLQRLVRAVLPGMIERQQGKILLMGSASALRGMKRASSYSAARGAQLAYVRSVGVEVAKHNIQVNAIAQNFVDNPTYFPQSIQSNPAFQERIKREVPLGRLVSADEDAQFAAYLCSDAANCFVGQVFPVCGGWAD